MWTEGAQCKHLFGFKQTEHFGGRHALLLQLDLQHRVVLASCTFAASRVSYYYPVKVKLKRGEAQSKQQILRTFSCHQHEQHSGLTKDAQRLKQPGFLSLAMSNVTSCLSTQQPVRMHQLVQTSSGFHQPVSLLKPESCHEHSRRFWASENRNTTLSIRSAQSITAIVIAAMAFKRAVWTKSLCCRAYTACFSFC